MVAEMLGKFPSEIEGEFSEWQLIEAGAYLALRSKPSE